jgi:hypothetical protein
LWNQTEKLPKAKDLTEERARKCRAQIQKYPSASHWVQARAKLEASRFAITEWKPGFDDFLSESKRTRALEGKYDDKPERRAARGAGPPAGAYQRNDDLDAETQNLFGDLSHGTDTQ